MKDISVSISIILFFLSMTGFVNAGNDSDSSIVERSPVIAFFNAAVIDGTGAPEKSKQTVIISDGRIVDIGPDDQIKIPKNAKRISMAGKTLLPGWVMHHEHLYYKSDHKEPYILSQHPINFPKLYLAAGITSARTAGSIEPYTDLNIKGRIDAGDMIGPDLDLTAPYLEGAPAATLQQHTLKSAEEARAMVRYWAEQGFTSFKAYSHISQDQLAAAVEESHKLGLKITAHACSVTYREAAEVGIDQLEHGFFPATDFLSKKKKGKCPDVIENLKAISELTPEDKKVKNLFRYLIEKNVVVTSTLDVTARVLGVGSELPGEVSGLLDMDSGTKYQQLLAAQVESERLPFAEKLMLTGQALEAAFWRAGGKLVVGTDPTVTGVIPGYGSLRSIELLVQAGIPPLEVIKIATHNGAEAMGVVDDRGTIAPGKRADLIIINGNPFKNFQDIYNIDLVFKNGIGYNPAVLKASVNKTIGGPG